MQVRSFKYLVKSLSLNARRVAEAHRIRDLILEGTNSIAKSNASGVIKCLSRPRGPVHVTLDGPLVQSTKHTKDLCNGSLLRERYATPVIVTLKTDRVPQHIAPVPHALMKEDIARYSGKRRLHSQGDDIVLGNAQHAQKKPKVLGPILSNRFASI